MGRLDIGIPGEQAWWGLDMDPERRGKERGEWEQVGPSIKPTPRDPPPPVLSSLHVVH